MEEISIIFVFLAGVVSFLSPCVLSLVPAYIGFISEDVEPTNRQNRFFILQRALLFITGFSLIFILMGASFGLIGGAFIKYRAILMKISGGFMIIFGLKMLGIIKLIFLNREFRIKSPTVIKGKLDSLLMGMAFATGWTPCVGPVLASVLLFVSSTARLIDGIILLLLYSLGLAVPFVITALTLGSFYSLLDRYGNILPLITKIGGILLLVMGVLVYTNKLFYLYQFFNFFQYKL